MRIQIAELAPVPRPYYSASKESLSRKFFQGTVFKHHSDLIQGSIYHQNYLEYLTVAYQNHHGIVINPYTVWYTLLCELASIVKESPKEYEPLFTTTPDNKQTITVKTDDPYILPLEKIVEKLKNLVPSDVDLFLPTFSTPNKIATFAHYAAFADMVSPYYNYGMYLCGIPYVVVEGDYGDWLAIATHWAGISNLFTKLKSYFIRVEAILSKIYLNTINWKDIFYTKHCGSGSQQELYGWYTDLYYKQPSFRLASNFSSNLAQVKYKNISTGKEYIMYNGILSSKLDDDCLIPEFGYIIGEKL